MLVADLLSAPSGYGGMMTAGLFLEAFVAEGVRWAHLDIAGPAWNGASAHDATPKGATGVAVRTLVQLLEDLVPR